MRSGDMKGGSLWYWIFITAAACAAVSSAKRYKLRQQDHVRFSIASCNLTMNILRHLENNDDSNIVFSPISISTLLSILQQGARGQTLQELNQFLQLRPEETREGFRQLQLFKTGRGVQLKWGNQCYVKKGTELLTDFEKIVRRKFGLGVEEIDFENLPRKVVASKINRWVRLATRGKITDLIDPSMVSPDTALLLINAMFFKGNWLRPFKKSKSEKDMFYISDNSSVTASFMNQKGKFYSEKDTSLGVKWLLLPFEDTRFGMFFLLPTKNHQLSQVVNKLSGEDLSLLFSLRKVSNVKVRIPKFKLSEKFSLVETLQELGLEQTLSGEADLRGMVSEHLQVSDMIHEAVVEIDEKGSTSSAATVIQFLRMGTPGLSFTANQPFLFFVLDMENNVPLFAGKVSNPVAKSA